MTSGRCGRDRMVVGFTITYAISAYTLWVWIALRRDVLDTALCVKVCQWLAVGLWFSPCNPVFSNNNSRDLADILVNVGLSTITLTPNIIIDYTWSVSGITCINYSHIQKIGKRYNKKSVGSRNTKGHKQDSQNRMWSHIPDGGEL